MTSPFESSVVVVVGKRQARARGGWLNEWAEFARASPTAEVLLVHGNLTGMPDEGGNLRLVAGDEAGSEAGGVGPFGQGMKDHDAFETVSDLGADLEGAGRRLGRLEGRRVRE